MSIKLINENKKRKKEQEKKSWSSNFISFPPFFFLSFSFICFPFIWTIVTPELKPLSKNLGTLKPLPSVLSPSTILVIAFFFFFFWINEKRQNNQIDCLRITILLSLLFLALLFTGWLRKTIMNCKWKAQPLHLFLLVQALGCLCVFFPPYFHFHPYYQLSTFFLFKLTLSAEAI